MRAQHIAPAAIAALFSLSAVAQISLSPTNASQLQAPTPQRQQPHDGGRQPVTPPIGALPQTRTQLQAAKGILSGYVYWDPSLIRISSTSPCSGFVVQINQGTPPAGGAVGFEQFKVVGTYQGKFTSAGTLGKYAVCQYAVDHLPEGTDLQVQIAPPRGVTLSPVTFTVPPTSNDPDKPIQIPGGQCNQVPPASPSLSTLGSAWWTCGDYAYNVNYLMQPFQSIPGLTQPPPSITVVQPQPLLPPPGPPSGMASPASQQKTLLPATGPTMGMVSQGPSQTPVAVNPGFNQATGTANPGPVNKTAGNPGPTQTSLATSTANPSRVPTARVINRTGPLTAFKLSTPQQSRKITNPNAAIQNSQIIAVLQNQTKAAEAEIAAMKLSLRPAGMQVNPGPSQTMAAGGTPSVGAVPVQANLLAGNNPSGPHTSIGSVMPAQFQNLAITCSNDPSMRVLTVSGGQSSAVFTQDSKYNFYTISGCSFGDPGPNAKAYIYSQGTFREDLQIEQWSDNWLKLSIDPNLKGVDDQDNVTLVIQRADGKQAVKSGFRFYAARETVLVHSIPQQYFSLDRFRPDNAMTNSWTPAYTSASSAAVAPNLPGLSAEVQWLLTPVSSDQIVGGSDIYDFSHLHPTFGLDSALMEWEDISCDPSSQQFVASKDTWAVSWYQNSGVQVTWQGQTCNPKPGSCGGAFQGDCFLGQPESNYGVDVWVTGPRGLDPWTGKPTA